MRIGYIELTANPRIAADVFLEERFKHPPVDWSAGHNLQSMNERRKQYIAALRAADAGELGPLLAFVGLR